MAEPLTLERLNAADAAGFVALLDGIYEHSPWIAERAASRRPFATLAQLKRALVETLRRGEPRRAARPAARPPRAGRQGDGRQGADRRVDRRAGQGRPDRNARPRSSRPCSASTPPTTRSSASRSCWRCAARAATACPRRRSSPPSSAGSRTIPTSSSRKALRNVHRVAELRLDDRFGDEPVLGQQAWDCAELLAHALRPGLRRERPAHRHLPHRRAPRLRGAAGALDEECGFDEVVDRCGRQRRRRLPRRERRRREAPAHRLALRHGAQRRQVRRPARHLRADGLRARAAPRRPAPAVRARGRRLRRGGRPALQGDLPRLGRADRPVRPALARPARRRRHHDARGDAPRRPAGDADGDRAAEARPGRLPRLRRGAHRAGPGADRPRPAARRRHLDQRRRALRRRGARHGQPRRHHADGDRGATPPPRSPSSPSTSRSAPPSSRTWSAPWACSRCRTARPTSFPAAAASRLDIRATTDPVRDDCVADVLAELHAICERRGVSASVEETMRAAAAPSAPEWQARWERAVAAAGLPVHRMPSGAGHDAMKLARGDAAGDAVRARRERRHQPQPARIDRPPTTCSSRSRRSCTCSTSSRPKPRRTPAMISDYARLDAWIDAHFAEETAFLQALVRVPTDTPPGDNAPHAERTADLLAGFGFIADRYAVPEADRARARAGLDHQPGRAPPLRRRARRSPSTRTATSCRRAKAGRHDPYGGDGRRRQALRPRRGGQQERLRDLHLRGARARVARRCRSRAASSCTSPTTRNSAASSGPGWLLKHGPDEARPADRRRLQLPGRHRAQRLPAARGHGARQDGPRRDSRRPASTRCRARSRS